MTIHLRQICLVAAELAPVRRQLMDVFSINPCFVDEGVAKFGLENVLLPVGSQFLEVVAPIQDDTAAGRYLARRGGDAGYMVICQVPTPAEQDACRQRAADNGVRVAWESDRGSYRLMQLHPRDMGAAFFEVDWDDRAELTGHWEPAGGSGWTEAVATDVVDAITGVELQGPDPVALAEHWGHVADSSVELRDGVPTVRLANADLRFVEATDGRGPGLGGVVVRATDPDRLLAQAETHECRTADGQISVCGTRFTIAN